MGEGGFNWPPPPIFIYEINRKSNKIIISNKLPLKKMINTVHNLITFSIVFTNKNEGGGRFNPPPHTHIKTRSFLLPIKT